MFNNEYFHINYKHMILNGNKSSTIGKSTIVAHRLSVHFQNILTPTKTPQKCLEVINHHIAAFREMLICLGQDKDCPELREEIRKLRSNLVEEFQITAHILISLNKEENVENENQYLILIFHLLQLFLSELTKSYRLTEIIHMDMKEYFENRAGPSNLGNVISEILLCQQIKPDFTSEELSSIIMHIQEMNTLLKEIEKFVPIETNSHFDIHNSWPLKRKRKLFCCGSLSNF